MFPYVGFSKTNHVGGGSVSSHTNTLLCVCVFFQLNYESQPNEPNGFTFSTSIDALYSRAQLLGLRWPSVIPPPGAPLEDDDDDGTYCNMRGYLFVCIRASLQLINAIDTTDKQSHGGVHVCVITEWHTHTHTF